MTKCNPIHPGEIVRRQCIEALGLTMNAAAEALDISRQHLHRIVTGTNPVTAEMAFRLSQVFGSTAETWLAMQATYDLAQLSKADKIHLHRIEAAA